MGLVPDDVLKRIPAMGSDPDTPLRDTVVHARLFDPESSWQWFIMESADSETFFGIVVSGSVALAGQFGLNELEALQDPDGEPAVRFDPDFQPLTAAKLAEKLPTIAGLLKEPSPREINRVRELVDLDPGD